ncbi:isocitrate lyase [Pseudohyphozyma bogoriensis]|nr:isocitrate lyase [Pseudohyphozyma bogoriensis]
MSASDLEPSTWQSPEAIAAWWKTPSQDHFHRPYSAELVASLRQPLNEGVPGNAPAMKFRKMLQDNIKNKATTFTIGAYDVQSAIMMGDVGFDTVYISGAGVSMSDVPGTYNMSADQSDYPYTTVPAKAKLFFQAQLLHSRLDQTSVYSGALAKEKVVDRMLPIIADADSGHGSSTATMKMVKLFVESGTSAIHIDDLLAGVKDYRHSNDRVMVPTSEHIRRMLSAKLQLDIMGSEMILIQRTDAERAGHITSIIDAEDRPFIMGTTNVATPYLVKALKDGQSEEEWVAAAKLCSFDEAVKAAVSEEAYAKFVEETKGLNIGEAKQYAAREKLDVYWDCEAPRGEMGWYRYRGCVEASIARSKALWPYCDMLWSCVPVMDIDDAETYAKVLSRDIPGVCLGYNITGNPGAVKGKTVSDDEIKGLVDKLGGFGFHWQFVPMAGQNGNSVGLYKYLKDLKEESLLGFVKNVTRSPWLDEVCVPKWYKSSGKMSDYLLGAVRF